MGIYFSQFHRLKAQDQGARGLVRHLELHMAAFSLFPHMAFSQRETEK